MTLDVVTTRHGPIITELLPGETRKIALRWTLQDGMGLMFFDVNSAQNWDEFRKAFSNFWRAGTKRDVRAMWMVTSDIRRRAECRSAPRAMAACR